MKKNKLLAILLAAPLLASCGVSKLKEPKFADAGKELSFEKFQKALEKAGVPDKLDFAVEKKLPSSVFVEELKAYNGYDLLREDKVKESAANLETYKDEWKLDTENVLLEHNMSTSTEFKAESANTKSSGSQKEQSKASYQEETINKKKFTVSIDQTNKEYSRYSDSSVTKADLAIDGKLKEEVSDAGTLFVDMVYGAAMSSKEELKHFKFYQNDKVFTITWEDEAEDKTLALYNISTKYVQKTQIDVTKGKFKAVNWYSSEEVKSFKKTGTAYDFYGEERVFYKGETIKEYIQTAQVASFEYKDVKLNKVDISDYTQTLKGGAF